MLSSLSQPTGPPTHLETGPPPCVRSRRITLRTPRTCQPRFRRSISQSRYARSLRRAVAPSRDPSSFRNLLQPPRSTNSRCGKNTDPLTNAYCTPILPPFLAHWPCLAPRSPTPEVATLEKSTPVDQNPLLTPHSPAETRQRRGASLAAIARTRPGSFPSLRRVVERSVPRTSPPPHSTNRRCGNNADLSTSAAPLRTCFSVAGPRRAPPSDPQAAVAALEKSIPVDQNPLLTPHSPAETRQRRGASLAAKAAHSAAHVARALHGPFPAQASPGRPSRGRKTRPFDSAAATLHNRLDHECGGAGRNWPRKAKSAP